MTGGLENPFSILLLVPVTISATHLSGKSSLLLGATTLTCITLLALYHEPLPLPDGSYHVSSFYLLAIWTALILGTVFLSGYAWLIAGDSRRVIEALSAARLALAREQQLSAVGGIAAAAAHELGTPLNTILLVAKDLINDLDPDSPLMDDAELLYGQAKVCKQVLAQISEKSVEGGMELHGDHFGFLPLPAIISMIIDKQKPDKKKVEIITPQNAAPPPIIAPTAEFFHGLGNFISNAIEFSDQHVKIMLNWTGNNISVEICDDGPGFSPDILNLAGEPYNSSRQGNGGMGLGIFIAKTLLARTGADISIYNGKEGGARVKIIWPRTQLENRMSAEQKNQVGQNDSKIPCYCR